MMLKLSATGAWVSRVKISLVIILTLETLLVQPLEATYNAQMNSNPDATQSNHIDGHQYPENLVKNQLEKPPSGHDVIFTAETDNTSLYNPPQDGHLQQSLPLLQQHHNDLQEIPSQHHPPQSSLPQPQPQQPQQQPQPQAQLPSLTNHLEQPQQQLPQRVQLQQPQQQQQQQQLLQQQQPQQQQRQQQQNHPQDQQPQHQESDQQLPPKQPQQVQPQQQQHHHDQPSIQQQHQSVSQPDVHQEQPQQMLKHFNQQQDVTPQQQNQGQQLSAPSRPQPVQVNRGPEQQQQQQPLVRSYDEPTNLPKQPRLNVASIDQLMSNQVQVAQQFGPSQAQSPPLASQSSSPVQQGPPIQYNPQPRVLAPPPQQQVANGQFSPLRTIEQQQQHHQQPQQQQQQQQLAPAPTRLVPTIPSQPPVVPVHAPEQHHMAVPPLYIGHQPFIENLRAHSYADDNIVTLNLSHSHIYEIDSEAFVGQRFEQIDLSNNKLGLIHSRSFRIGPQHSRHHPFNVHGSSNKSVASVYPTRRPPPTHPKSVTIDFSHNPAIVALSGAFDQIDVPNCLLNFTNTTVELKFGAFKKYFKDHPGHIIDIESVDCCEQEWLLGYKHNFVARTRCEHDPNLLLARVPQQTIIDSCIAYVMSARHQMTIQGPSIIHQVAAAAPKSHSNSHSDNQYLTYLILGGTAMILTSLSIYIIFYMFSLKAAFVGQMQTQKN